MSDITFRKINGRIVPIRKKDGSNPTVGAGKITAGAAIGYLGASSATKDLKKSFSLFRKSAQITGLSKLAQAGSSTRSKFIKNAAKFKLGGIKKARISKTKFGLALGISSLVISSGVTDFFPSSNEYKDEISSAVGSVVAAGIAYKAGKKFGLKARNISDLFSGFSRTGRMKSGKKVRDIAKTAFNPKNVRKGTQLDLGF